MAIAWFAPEWAWSWPDRARAGLPSGWGPWMLALY